MILNFCAGDQLWGCPSYGRLGRFKAEAWHQQVLTCRREKVVNQWCFDMLGLQWFLTNFLRLKSAGGFQFMACKKWLQAWCFWGIIINYSGRGIVGQAQAKGKLWNECPCMLGDENRLWALRQSTRILKYTCICPLYGILGHLVHLSNNSMVLSWNFKQG